MHRGTDGGTHQLLISSTTSLPLGREAHTKAALSFQILEAALPLGIPAGEPIQLPLKRPPENPTPSVDNTVQT
jgi:hypothetical protein